ncbi:MAG TPA: hypothetical protein VIT23_07890 [Terrimicrobiaceae bacterium]
MPICIYAPPEHNHAAFQGGVINGSRAISNAITGQNEFEEKCTREASLSGTGIAEIIRRLEPCVPLRVEAGEKRPLLAGWPELTLADITPKYLAGFNGDNIGISLGKASEGLCTVDADDDAFLREFLQCNPLLKESLISRAERGGNVWLRIKGNYPRAGKIKTGSGSPWGEWRADGNQTVIYGQHPSGCPYRDNGKGPLELEFEDINWPEGLVLPWDKSEPVAVQDPLDGSIILPSGKLGILETGQRAFTILARSRTLFLYGSKVCEIIEGDDGGFLRLDVVSDQAFRSRIERHGKVVAYRVGPHGEELVKPGACCSLDTARAWLNSDARKMLPTIATIHNCPLLAEKNKGEMHVLGKGHHPNCGGLLVTGGELPSRLTLVDSVDLVFELLEEFDFASPADKSRAAAAIITPALKFAGLLSTHTPLFVVEATESQTGKGFLLELVQAIYRETPSLITQRQGGVGGFDESLSQALLNAKPFIQIDNVRGRINSPFFEAILTCPLGGTVPARVPHKGEIQIKPERFVFQLTSNGFQSTRDLANRSCIIRLRKRYGHSFRRYPEGDLSDHVRANQAKYLGAVYALVSAWVARGKEQTNDTHGEGRFRRWAQIMDWIIPELLGLPPLMDGHEEAQERTANPALNWLRKVCIAAQEDARTDDYLTASDIVELCHTHLLDIPGLAYGAPEVKANLRVGQIMGKLFRNHERIVCDTFEVSRDETVRFIESSGQEKPMKRYLIRAMPNTTNTDNTQVNITTQSCSTNASIIP